MNCILCCMKIDSTPSLGKLVKKFSMNHEYKWCLMYFTKPEPHDDIYIIDLCHVFTQPESQPLNPMTMGSVTSLDVDRIQRKNDARLRRLQQMNG